MADDTCITNDTSNNETYTHVEPYYITTTSNFTSYTQILFIDSVLETPIDPFSHYVNESTFALIYKHNTDRDSILEFLNNFTNIKRIGFAFHGPSSNHDFIPTRFIHNELLYTPDDISVNQTVCSSNVLFVKHLIQLYPDTLKYIDFLEISFPTSPLIPHFHDVSRLIF